MMAKSPNLLYSPLSLPTSAGETTLSLPSILTPWLSFNRLGTWCYQCNPWVHEALEMPYLLVPTGRLWQPSLFFRDNWNLQSEFVEKTTLSAGLAGYWGFLRGQSCFRRVTLLHLLFPSQTYAHICILEDNKTVPVYSMLTPVRNWAKIAYIQQPHYLIQNWNEYR